MLRTQKPVAWGGQVRTLYAKLQHLFAKWVKLKKNSEARRKWADNFKIKGLKEWLVMDGRVLIT